MSVSGSDVVSAGGRNNETCETKLCCMNDRVLPYAVFFNYEHFYTVLAILRDCKKTFSDGLNDFALGKHAFCSSFLCFTSSLLCFVSMPTNG